MTPTVPKAWCISRALVYQGRAGALVVVAGSGRELHVCLAGDVVSVTTLPWGWRSSHQEDITDLLAARIAETTVDVLKRGQGPEAGDVRP